MNARSVAALSASSRVMPLVALLAALSTAGCGADVVSPTRRVLAARVLAARVLAARVNGGAHQVNLSGHWAWSETVTTIFPPFIAGIVGIEPEGPVTHATCYDAGVLTLVQTGDTFVGTATQTSTCTTRGGQQYQPPFPPTLEVLGGQIHGQSFEFEFSGGCPYRGTASLVDGVVVRIGGTGKCEIFLHPALLKTVSWQATRL
jgi:hypothetical protein